MIKGREIKLEEIISGLDVPSNRSKALAWEMLNERLEETPAEKKTIKLSWWIGAAAAAAVFAAILWVGMFNTGKYSPEFATGFAVTDTLFLPDSSSVILSPNSSVMYSYDKIFGERNIKLQGEAFFDVKKGKKFSVLFNGGEVKVLGTSFNVTAYNDKFTNVDCVEGRVEVAIGEESFLLNKGYGLKMEQGSVTGPFKINREEVESRITGTYYYDSVSLQELASLIGHRFGYQIKIDETAKNRHFAGKISLKELNSAMFILSTAMGIDFNIDENSNVIEIHAN